MRKRASSPSGLFRCSKVERRPDGGDRAAAPKERWATQRHRSGGKHACAAVKQMSNLGFSCATAWSVFLRAPVVQRWIVPLQQRDIAETFAPALVELGFRLGQRLW